MSQLEPRLTSLNPDNANERTRSIKNDFTLSQLEPKLDEITLDTLLECGEIDVFSDETVKRIIMREDYVTERFMSLRKKILNVRNENVRVKWLEYWCNSNATIGLYYHELCALIQDQEDS